MSVDTKRRPREDWRGWLIGALWVVTMGLAGAWGARIDSRLASIDDTLTKSAAFRGAVEATLKSHDRRITRLEDGQ